MFEDKNKQIRKENSSKVEICNKFRRDFERLKKKNSNDFYEMSITT